MKDTHPMHIDASIIPLASGRLLANPERMPEVPALFRDWEVLYAPPPAVPHDPPLHMSSSWVSMNVLSLDERHVVVESQEEPLIRCLRAWGFEPVPCAFRSFNRLGGSFHCATLDVRRRGTPRFHL